MQRDSIDSSAFTIADEGFPYLAASFLFFTLNLVLIGFFQSIERPKPAITFMLLRGFVVLAPCFIVLPCCSAFPACGSPLPLPNSSPASPSPPSCSTTTLLDETDSKIEQPSYQIVTTQQQRIANKGPLECINLSI